MEEKSAKTKTNFIKLQESFENFTKTYTLEEFSPKIVENFTEIIKSIIYGQKNSSLFFEFLIESHLLEYYITLLPKINSDLQKIKLIQSFSFLISNTKSAEYLSYIISNQILNKFLKYDFDFKNEEIIFYFISFLKSLSQKLELFPIEIFYNLVS